MKRFDTLLCLAFAWSCQTPCPRCPKPQAAQGLATSEDLPNASTWLDADSRRASGGGAEASVVVAVGAMARGEPLSGTIEVPKNDCILAIARGHRGLKDIDLFAYGDDGETLGVDEKPDRTPSLLICPPHPQRIFLVARAASGHGLAAIGAQRVNPRNAKRAQKLTQQKSKGPEFPGLREAHALHLRRLGGSWQQLRRVHVPLETRAATHISGHVREAACIDFFVLPSASATYLDATISDARGQIIGRLRRQGRARSVTLCSRIPQDVTLQIRPHAGNGVGAVVISESELSSRPRATMLLEASPTLSVAQAQQRKRNEFKKLGLGRAAFRSQGRLRVGRRSSHALTLGNDCNRIDLVAGAPLSGLSITLWDNSAHLLAKTQGYGDRTLVVCGAKGAGRLDLEALASGGPYVIEHRKLKHPLLGKTPLPLASSRALQPLFDHGTITSLSQIEKVLELRLSSSQRRDVPLTIPKGRCTELSLGLAGDGGGVEMRFVKRAGSGEDAVAHGESAAGLRLCSVGSGPALAGRLEIQLTRGQSRALLLTRAWTPRP